MSNHSASQFTPVNSVTGLLIGALVTIFVIWISKIVIIWWQNRKRFVELAEKLPGPEGLPLIGNALHFACKSDQLLDRLVQAIVPHQDETPMRLWLGPLLIVVVSEPRHLEIILSDRKSVVRGSLSRAVVPLFGNGLMSGSDHNWRSHRKLIATTFNGRTLELFAEVVQRHSKVLVEKLKPIANGVEFDVGPYLTRCTIDASCEAVMGCSDMNAQGDPDQQFIHAVERMYELVSDRLWKVWLHPDWIFRLSSTYQEQKPCQRIIRNFIGKLITAKQEELADAPKGETDCHEGQPKSMLEQVIRKIHQGEDILMTDEELRDEIFTVYIASQDATAAAGNFTLLMLAIHEDVQENVRSELNRVLQEDAEDIPASSLPKLKYLEMVIKETLRLFPAAPVVGRALKSDLVLDTCEFPKGCELVLAFHVTHRNPRFWKSPDKFIPERFTPEEAALRHPYAYVPFSGGPMGCMGQKVALDSLKLIVANVVRGYRIDTSVRMEDVKIKSDIVIRSVDGFKLSLEPLRL